LPEYSVRERLESIEKDSGGALAYQESAAFQQVTRTARTSPALLLKKIYKPR